MQQRIGSAWNVARFFSRMLIEHIATVWLLGIAPFLAHLAAASPQHGYRWIPNDLYLFVMVIGGTLGMEAFKDRSSPGPLRPLAGVAGFIYVLGGAWAYASLEAGNGVLALLLKHHVLTVISSLLGIDLVYRVPKIMEAAMHENARKIGS